MNLEKIFLKVANFSFFHGHHSKTPLISVQSECMEFACSHHAVWVSSGSSSFLQLLYCRSTGVDVEYDWYVSVSVSGPLYPARGWH